MTQAARARVVALDIGGASIKSALVAASGAHGAPATTPIDSRADGETIVATIACVVGGHLEEAHGDVLGVAAGCPGPFDYRAGVSWIRGVGKYEAIYGVDLGAAIRRRLGLPGLAIVWRNDAEAAIAGEARYGAGRQFRRLVGVTLGTGIGSAFMVDGRPVSEGAGVPANGWLYPLPVGGVQADDVFSTRGLLARLRMAEPASASVSQAAVAARDGNEPLRAQFEAFGAELGAFLGPIAAEFGAQAVLALGGIAGALDLWGAAAQRRLHVPLVAGQLGAVAPLLGAAEVLLGTP